MPVALLEQAAQAEIDKEVEMLNPNPAWLKTMRIVAGVILVASIAWVFIICAFAYHPY